ncbi:saccharopine dehydrogenase family protein [Nodosilinea sp. PGN35]|uniref:saccharopine dehydrogenase family protein n=1 Tax=Nodosilinea sp. PGN35 TaxID=3020489 RepID=UPI0023B2791B|nr:saccharopine dehydrogenase NADP-binding domain-containing protein [Nodosilinea sp. TSF1-S3]MDF0369037.1 saccharopine dehydrogenase NADP-binding domain-containing protein [Nodosilinea sp. TSF1-S3]
MQRVLIIGGCGRIGSNIAKDILAHTDAAVTITGRSPQQGLAVQQRLGSRVEFHPLDLGSPPELQAAVAQADLVVHSAGPFHYRDAQVLHTCIEQKVNYTDVSDERSFTRKALALHPEAEAAGVTAVINSGVFPGISNSMVRQGVEALDEATSIQLSYIVAGSGGAGVTVMRTTFIGLQHPFDAWLDGRWQSVKPYTARETLEFPAPYGRASVYWYDMPEAITLQQTFPVSSVITKFGVVPGFYNHATRAMAHWLPPRVLRHRQTVEFLAQVSHAMTDVTDRFSGTGVAMRCDIWGQQEGIDSHYVSTFAHDSAAIATGLGTGSIAELLLNGTLRCPGVHPVEQALSTDLFAAAMAARQLTIHQTLQRGTADSQQSETLGPR